MSDMRGLVERGCDIVADLLTAYTSPETEAPARAWLAEADAALAEPVHECLTCQHLDSFERREDACAECQHSDELMPDRWEPREAAK